MAAFGHSAACGNNVLWTTDLGLIRLSVLVESLAVATFTADAGDIGADLGEGHFRVVALAQCLWPWHKSSAKSVSNGNQLLTNRQKL